MDERGACEDGALGGQSAEGRGRARKEERREARRERTHEVFVLDVVAAVILLGWRHDE